MSKKLSDEELGEFEKGRDVWSEVLTGIQEIKQERFERKTKIETLTNIFYCFNGQIK